MPGLPKDVRELVRFASDAVNAHQRGLSIPTVALHYRFEMAQKGNRYSVRVWIDASIRGKHERSKS
jgi:hypothetical protein